MDKKNASKGVAVRGYLIVTEWDSDDIITAIGIENEEDEYVVEYNDLWEELLDYLDHELEVIGTINEDNDGTKRINVSDYEVLSDSPYEEDEDYGESDDDWEAGDDGRGFMH